MATARVTQLVEVKHEDNIDIGLSGLLRILMPYIPRRSELQQRGGTE